MGSARRIVVSLSIWLPILDKKIVRDADASQRFEWDFEATIAELFLENNFLQAREIINAAGLQMYLEPYTGPFSMVAAAAVPDMTMCEFWIHANGGIKHRPAIQSAQAAGIRVIGAEAFTASPEDARWSATPAEFKASGDGAFTQGINQLFLHSWVHQPFGDKIKPGLTMRYWGTHFGRNQTWHEPGKAWVSYLARCQALLQRGEPVADFLALDRASESYPYRADAISAQNLLSQATVKDGRIVLSSGRSYAFLNLPKGTVMLPATARKLKEIVQAGGIITGQAPEKSPSLQDFPGADSEVAAIGQELWGDGKESDPSSGKVFATPWDALKHLKLEPDFSVKPTMTENDGLLWTHRRDGNTDIYFLTNAVATNLHFTASFRVDGKIPEIWNAERGSKEEASHWEFKNGRTEIKMTLPANTSRFFIFRQPTSELFREPTPESQSTVAPLVVEGPWEVTFEAELSLPPEKAMYRKLASWTESSVPKIKYFSGTAHYATDIEVPEGLIGPGVTLDLGTVKEMAKVVVNGIDCGVVWHAPFQVDVGSALKLGRNHLEIAVTNTWANRLIGDEQEPEDSKYSAPNFRGKGDAKVDAGRSLLEFPEWLLQGTPRPTQRIGFSTWSYFTKDSPLLPAGLLGPVVLKR